MLDDGEVLHEAAKPKNPCKDQDSVANSANKADDEDIFSLMPCFSTNAFCAPIAKMSDKEVKNPDINACKFILLAKVWSKI
ncbi:hypothetical protein VB002_14620 [Campylobacter concisus]